MAITAELLMPPQGNNATMLNFVLILKNTSGTADTLALLEFASSSPFGSIQDFQTIEGTIVPANAEAVIPFAAAFAGCGEVSPLSLQEALVITMGSGVIVNPTHNTQVITIYNQLNQSELPSQPTSFAAAAASASATLTWVPPSSPGVTADGVARTLTGYLAIAVPQGSATAMPVFQQFASTQITFGTAGVNTDTITIGTGANAVVFTAAATGNGTTTFDSATSNSVTLAASTFTTSVNSGTQQAKLVTLMGTGAKVVATNPSAGVVLLTFTLDPLNAIAPGVAQPVVAAGSGVAGYTITNSPASGTGTMAETMTGLTSSVPYLITLFATNAKGNGALSAVVAVTPS